MHFSLSPAALLYESIDKNPCAPLAVEKCSISRSHMNVQKSPLVLFEPSSLCFSFFPQRTGRTTKDIREQERIFCTDFPFEMSLMKHEIKGLKINDGQMMP